MPITVRHGVPISALGQAGYVAGRGRYRQYLRQLQEAQAARDLQERMQTRSLEQQDRLSQRSLDWDRERFSRSLEAQNFSDFRRLVAENQAAYRDQGFRERSAAADYGMDLGRMGFQGAIQGRLAELADGRDAERQQAGFEQQRDLFGMEADLRRQLLERQADVAAEREQQEYTEGQRRFAEQIRNDLAAIDAAANGENPILTQQEAEAARRAVIMRQSHISQLPSPIPKPSPTVADAVQERVTAVDGVPGAFWVQQPDGKLDFKEAKPQKAPEAAIGYDDFSARYEASSQALTLNRPPDADPPTREEILGHMREMEAAYQSFAGSLPQQGLSQTAPGAGPATPPAGPGVPAAAGPASAVPAAAGPISDEQSAAVIANPLLADFSQAPPGPAMPFDAAYQQTKEALSDPALLLENSAFGAKGRQAGEGIPPMPDHTIEAYAYLDTFGEIPRGDGMRAWLTSLPPAQRAHVVAALKTASMSGLEGLPNPRSAEEASLIPPGVEYMAPDGTIRVRRVPGGQ